MAKHTIDASDKILGRLAVEIAVLLRGKASPEFVPYKTGKDVVEVSNVDRIALSGNKRFQKTYAHYSGYPGGLSQITYEKLEAKKPGETLRKAVYGMLPKNKLRTQIMKRLIIVNESLK